MDEHPEVAAVREAWQETGLEVELTGLRGVLGGPDFRITYANGDRTAYVSRVYDARVVGGRARPDQEETIELAWVAMDDLAGLALGGYARASLRDLGLL